MAFGTDSSGKKVAATPIRVVAGLTTPNEAGKLVPVTPIRYVGAASTTNELGRPVDALQAEIVAGLTATTADGKLVGSMPVRVVAGTITTDEAGRAVPVLPVFDIGGPPDTTAPTLSSPTDAANGSIGGTLTVTTNEANGTLYWYVSTSGAPPSAANLKTGSGAVSFGNQAVSATGVQNVNASGLTASTTYYGHFLHRDAAGNDSAIASGNGFTTDAAVTHYYVFAGSSTLDGKGVDTAFVALCSVPPTYDNVAVSGSSMLDLKNDPSPVINALTARPGFGQQYVALYSGSNDLHGGISGQSSCDNLDSFIAQVRAVHPAVKFVLFTMNTRKTVTGTSGTIAKKDSWHLYNRHVRAVADYVVDLAADGRLADPNAESLPYFTGDGTHMNSTGSTLAGTLMHQILAQAGVEGGTAGTIDYTPSAFTFTDVTGAPLSTLTVGAPATISGLNSPATVVSTSGEVSIAGGAYSEGVQTITNGQTITPRTTSSAFNSTDATATISVGPLSRTFKVTTEAVVIPPDPVYETEAVTLFSAMTSAPDATRKHHINELIKSLKSATVWAKLKYFYMLAAHSSQASLLNWFAPGANDLAMTGNCGFTADRGWESLDTVTSNYLSNGVAFNAMTVFLQDDNFWAVGVGTAVAGQAFGTSSTSGHQGLQTTATPAVNFRNSSATLSGLNGALIGRYATARNNSANFIRSRNGAESTVTQASSAPNTQSARLLRSGTTQSQNVVVPYFVFAGYLDATQRAAFDTAIETYLVAVGSPA